MLTLCIVNTDLSLNLFSKAQEMIYSTSIQNFKILTGWSEKFEPVIFLPSKNSGRMLQFDTHNIYKVLINTVVSIKSSILVSLNQLVKVVRIGLLFNQVKV